MRLLFLKYILEQSKESNVRKMLSLQLEKPSPGDWASTCFKDLENINLKLTLDEIRTISKQKYLMILKEKIKDSALKYLLSKQGKKGSEISFLTIEMSEYLQPFNKSLTIEQKREMFAVRNRMVNIQSNFSSQNEVKCECGKTEDMVHIYECEIFCDNKQPTIPYGQIFNGNLKEQIMVYTRFSENLKTRMENKQQSYPFGQYDPLLCPVAVRDQ